MRNYTINLNIRGSATRTLRRMELSVYRLNRGVSTLGSTFSRLTGGSGFSRLGQMASLFTSIATSIARITVKLHALSYLAGPVLLKKGADLLLNPQMGEGIKYLQRQEQARKILGSNAAEAQRRAMDLAQAFALDPSAILSGMATITGMRAGKNRITLGQAERLMLFGGLASQQTGLPMNAVVLNLQQIMAHTVPIMRDINQLLTHAPILGRYAIEELEKRGLTGKMGHRELMQDKTVLLSLIDRFLNETPGVAASKARGMVSTANLEFFAELAKNPNWVAVAEQYVDLLSRISKVLSDFISGLANAPGVQLSIERFTILLEKLAGGGLASMLDKALNWVHDITGIGLSEEEEKRARRQAQAKVGVSALLEKLPMYLDERDVFALAEVYKEKGWTLPETMSDIPGDIRRRLPNLLGLATVYTGWFPHEALEQAKAKSQTLYPLPREWWYGEQWLREDHSIPATEWDKYQPSTSITFGPQFFWKSLFPNTPTGTINLGSGGKMTPPKRETIPYVGLSLGRVIEELRKLPAGGSESLVMGAGGTEDGSTISGYAKDRKALIINFNAPIVEWDSTINTDDPNEVVQEVSTSIENAASRAIQIALLGATGKMNTRW